jgi:hypothetical protein
MANGLTITLPVRESHFLFCKYILGARSLPFSVLPFPLSFPFPSLFQPNLVYVKDEGGKLSSVLQIYLMY